jgi:hypothetical protein
MRTKLCVLGAVLGTASGWLPVGCVPAEAPAPGKEQPRGGVSRQAGRSLEGGAVARPPGVAGPEERGLGEPRHPCELITVMKVPCEPEAGLCEYTYWECPRQVKPLRA